MHSEAAFSKLYNLNPKLTSPFSVLYREVAEEWIELHFSLHDVDFLIGGLRRWKPSVITTTSIALIMAYGSHLYEQLQ